MIQKLDDHDQLALNFRALKAFITVDAEEERWLHEEPEDQVEHVSAVADAHILDPHGPEYSADLQTSRPDQGLLR